MLAWLISLVMLFAGCVNNNLVLVITSGLFAIAGNIGMAIYTGQNNQNNNKKSVPGKENT